MEAKAMMAGDMYTVRRPGLALAEAGAVEPVPAPQPACLDDHFFDEDEVLDYLWYEEMRKEDEGDDGPGNQGCLSLLAFLLLPVAGAGYALINHL